MAGFGRIMPDEYLEGAIADLDRILSIASTAEVSSSASPKWSEVGEFLEEIKAQAAELKEALEPE